ncbi:hypothetical protein DYI95_007875 [Thermaerobacter sp. PB12/4term]|uniref:hypothetical protein n=1 Tax=Thermaerobacter sp. PB12/4term TaxID=2293838 RepID=UPI000E32D2E2|nr:hypothetical protein [Thermaerobacter sp. PB12/4term]QIA27452.1 hypothetical protein DYI95_007875 [Thermaerobacter sp. PB12/4term]
MHPQSVEQCIQDCQQVINRLHDLANQVHRIPKARDMLHEGAHHLELCITECQFAVQRMRQTHHAPHAAPAGTWGMTHMG